MSAVAADTKRSQSPTGKWPSMQKPSHESIELAKTILDGNNSLMMQLAEIIGEVMELNRGVVIGALNDRRADFEALGAVELFEKLEDRINEIFEPYLADEDEGGVAVSPRPRHVFDESRPDEWFEKIVTFNGYPQAYFRLRFPDFELGDYVVYNEDTLKRRIESGRAKGRSVDHYERALKALQDAIKEWANKPWDGQ